MAAKKFEKQLLVDAAWLNEHRNDDDVIVLDATTQFGEAKGRDDYEREHIPEAVHADLLRDLADQSKPTAAMALPSEQFAEKIGKLGVSNNSHVVVYDQGVMMWATRLWWNLRLEGHDNISVLDGGLRAWKDAGYEVASGSESNKAATFTAHRRPELYADKERVKAAVDDDSVVLINALDEDAFSGARVDYGRAGHIPSSVNVPFQNAIKEGGRLVDVDQVRGSYEEIAALDDSKQPVTYCGGGIAATFDAFQLARLGRDDVAVYDGSMTEWAADDSLPLKTSN